MKYSTRVSDAVHVLAFIALNPVNSLTSEKIAESVRTNPGYVRQLMSALRVHGLLSSVKGHPRPALSRDPSAITLLDEFRSGKMGRLTLEIPVQEPEGKDENGRETGD